MNDQCPAPLHTITYNFLCMNILNVKVNSHHCILAFFCTQIIYFKFIHDIYIFQTASTTSSMIYKWVIKTSKGQYVF